MLPTTTQVPTTTHTPTSEIRFFGKSLFSEFDAAGKKRFTGNISLCVHVWASQKLPCSSSAFVGSKPLSSVLLCNSVLF